MLEFFVGLLSYLVSWTKAQIFSMMVKWSLQQLWCYCTRCNWPTECTKPDLYFKMGAAPSKLDELIGSLQPGDLIEFPNKMMKHFGVYVGKQILADQTEAHCVVHVSLGKLGNTAAALNLGKSHPPRFPSGPIPEKYLNQMEKDAKVVMEPLDAVPGFEHATKSNEDDETNGVKARNQIVQDAMKQVGNPFKFNMLNNNCEHFAKQCRYGKKESQQAREAVLKNLKVLEEYVDTTPDISRRVSELKKKVIVSEGYDQEMHQREIRKKSLIVFGLPDTDCKIEDEMWVKLLLIQLKLNYQMSIDKDFEEISRLGKTCNPGAPRALRLKMKNLEKRQLILDNKNMLKDNPDFKRVTIHPDLTKLQQQMLKKYKK